MNKFRLKMFLGVFFTFFSIYASGDVTETKLYQYVHADSVPPIFGDERFAIDHKGLDIREYVVKSQEWQGFSLYNEVYVVMPKHLIGQDVKRAVLMITGGSWRDYYLEAATDEEIDDFKKDLRLYSRIAKDINSPMVVVRNVPFQRMTELNECPLTHPRGIKEDDLIGCTFKYSLDTGDDTWAALFPMTKSAHVALDLAQEVFKKEWGLEIESFTAMGASKRGWTAFLHAAVDDRVTAACPMVIDMLNMKAQNEHYITAWGEPSLQVQDYVNHGVLTRFNTPEGERLLSNVDPYSYRNYYGDKPILMVLGTNDEYWPVDAANLYFGDLGSKKYLLYLPNQGHKATDIDRIMNTCKAVHESASRGISLPELDWNFDENLAEQSLTVSFSSNIIPNSAFLWRVRSDSSNDRDFRDDSYSKNHLCGEARFELFGSWNFIDKEDCNGSQEIVVETPDDECGSYYVEMFFEHAGLERYSLSTLPVVTGGEACKSTQYLAGLRDSITVTDLPSAAD